MSKRNIIWILIILSGTIGLIVLVWFSITLSQNFSLGGKLLVDATGVTGDFIGGVVGTLWGLTSILMFYQALSYQKEAIEIQTNELKTQQKELQETRKAFEKQNLIMGLQQFENTFFKLVELHHVIIEKLSHEFKYIDGSSTLIKKFQNREMLSEAKNILYNSIKVYAKSNNSNDNNEDKNAWIIIQKKYEEFYYASGIGVKLSHYYRNVYHIFKFIYGNNSITVEQKKEYASIARSQLSQDELFLLFYNSMYLSKGNPKFLFLIKYFDIMQNFDFAEVNTFKSHKEIYNALISTVVDCLANEAPEPVYPPEEFLHQPI